MGLFNWLRAKISPASATNTSPASVEDDGEKTTFIKGRLSAKAQMELKRLRQLKGEGATRYQWEGTQFACFESKKFVTEGPYEITLGLVTVAPVPGRETSCECDCAVVRATKDAYAIVTNCVLYHGFTPTPMIM
jgi:hypothetical protein